VHNARSYDSHFIIKHFHDPKAKIQVISTNTEKFLALQIDSIRFLDSFQFLSSSLDNLVSTMARDGIDKFVHTKRHFGNDPNVLKKAYTLTNTSRAQKFYVKPAFLREKNFTVS